MNDIEKQLKNIEKKLQEKTNMKMTPDELFSEDFMSKNDIHKNIHEIFEEANVVFEHITSLSTEEKTLLTSVVKSSTKFNSWDEFIQSAGKFHMANKFKSLGLMR